MTLDELINELKKLKYDQGLTGDTPVVLQGDPEGNRYIAAEGVEDALATGELGGYPEVFVPHRRIGTLGFTEDDRAPEGSATVVVVYP